MRILVCGGRYYNDRARVFEILDILKGKLKDQELLVINGGASGADKLSDEWAEDRKVPSCSFRAYWRTLARSAGPIRNGWMLKYGLPELVVAFPGGRGTADMVERAVAAGIPVWKIPVQSGSSTE